MSLMGKEGLPDLATICFEKSQYAASQISKINGFKLFKNRTDFIKEFTIQTKYSSKKIQKKAEECGLLFDCLGHNLIKFCFTEKRTKEDIDKLIEFLKSYNE